MYLKILAAGRRRFVSRRFVLGMTDEAAQVLTVSFRIFGDEGFEGLVVARNQAVSPAFQSVEALVVLAGRGIELINQGENGVDILITHQLADVLQMAFARDMRGVF